MLVDSGTILLKYWLDVSDEEQEARFQDRLRRSWKRWKLSPMDLFARSRWSEYADFLWSLGTTCHGHASVLVRANSSVFASAYSLQRERAKRSMGDSFQRFQDRRRRSWTRASCSSSETSSQYLRRMVPLSTSIFSKGPTCSKNTSSSESEQKPMTRSTLIPLL